MPVGRKASVTAPCVALLEAFDASLQAQILEIVGDDLDLVFVADNAMESRRAALNGAEYAVVRTIPLEPELLDHAPRLKLIHQWGTGVDGIPLAAARSRRIVVARSPGVNAPSVADLTVGLMLAARRRIPQGDARLRDGSWAEPNLYEIGQDLCGSRVGLVGFGAIGKEIMRRLSGFDCDIRYTRSSGPDPAIPGYMGLDDLVRWAEILSLHLPLTDETRNLIGPDRLARMPRGACLVNTARGGIVDEAALALALSSGHLGAAAIDAYSQEPPLPDNPLLSAPNTVLSAHSGGRTRGNLARLVRHWSGNIRTHHGDGRIDPACLVFPEE